MIIDVFQIVAIVILIGYCISVTLEIKKLRRKTKELNLGYSAALHLIIAETKRKEQQANALKRLTDPDLIADEMERGARKREMHDANRKTLPRDNAGPPAKVYTPQMRAKIPRFKPLPDHKKKS